VAPPNERNGPPWETGRPQHFEPPQRYLGAGTNGSSDPISPSGEQGGPASEPPSSTRRLTPTLQATSDSRRYGELPAAEPRAGGLVRVVHSRDIRCTCQNCGRTFTNTGSATSHAKAKRHRVEVSYYASFAFVPRERRVVS
jgi:hypothetical protein